MVTKSGKLHVLVLFGGRSGEHEVSVLSARSVIHALNPQHYEIIQVGIAQDGSWWTGQDVLEKISYDIWLKELIPVALLPDPSRPGLISLGAEIPGWGDRLQPDVVFPVLHGTYGEDGTLQGLLEMADLPYVGAGVIGSALGMDKAIFKDVMRAHDIPVLEMAVFLRSQIEQDLDEVIEAAEALAEYPLFVKPANLGSSVGISKCSSRSDLVEGLLDAARYDRKVLVERGLNAREIEVSVLGNDQPQASVPGEILPSRDFYSYEAKYIDGKSGLLIPAPLPSALAERIRSLAVQAYRAIDCCGMARVDFLLEKSPEFGDGLFLSEVNTIPGFTQISMYPKLWEATGLPYPNLLDRLIEFAIERKTERDRIERRFRREG